MDNVIFSEDSQIFKTQYFLNYAIKMHRLNAKNFGKFFSNDFFHKINNDCDFIAFFNRLSADCAESMLLLYVLFILL